MSDEDDDWPEMDDEGDCPDCAGSGEVHDCGEDTCCCADPETQDMVTCETCGGTGVL